MIYYNLIFYLLCEAYMWYFITQEVLYNMDKIFISITFNNCIWKQFIILRWKCQGLLR